MSIQESANQAGGYYNEQAFTDAGISADFSIYDEQIEVRYNGLAYHHQGCSVEDSPDRLEPTGYEWRKIISIMHEYASNCPCAAGNDRVTSVYEEAHVQFDCATAIKAQFELEDLTIRTLRRFAPLHALKYSRSRSFSKPPSPVAAKLIDDTVAWLKGREEKWSAWAKSPEGLLFLEKEAVYSLLKYGLRPEKDYRHYIPAEALAAFWDPGYVFADVTDAILPMLGDDGDNDKLMAGITPDMILAKLMLQVKKDKDRLVLAYAPSEEAEEHRNRAPLYTTFAARYSSVNEMFVIPASLRHLNNINNYVALTDSDTPQIVETACELFLSTRGDDLKLALELARAV